jgi:hypothetical protein
VCVAGGVWLLRLDAGSVKQRTQKLGIMVSISVLCLITPPPPPPQNPGEKKEKKILARTKLFGRVWLEEVVGIQKETGA